MWHTTSTTETLVITERRNKKIVSTFGRSCQGVPLGKQTTHNRVSTRGLEGGGQKTMSEWGLERGRQTGGRRETGEKGRGKRGEASCASWVLIRSTQAAQLAVERHWRQVAEAGLCCGHQDQQL